MSRRLFWVVLFASIMAVLPVRAQQLQNIAAPSIVINLPSRMLELYSDGRLVKTYPVAIGKPETPTPLGNFAITYKEINPVWIPPGRGYVVPSGPENPLGYRWMEFLPLYGVHGTNAPWTIGMAVSNGCVRMKEADAEELYDLIHYGTPVHIVYERIQVRTGARGEVAVGVYPDVYGYKPIDLPELKYMLWKQGLSDMASERFLLNLVQNPPDKQLVFARFFQLQLHGGQLNERGVLVDDSLYIPVWPVAAARNSNVVWDGQTRTVQSEGRSVTGRIMGDVIYITTAALEELYGIQSVWNEAGNQMTIE